jgi:phosphoribosylamine---glycine ligase
MNGRTGCALIPRHGPFSLALPRLCPHPGGVNHPPPSWSTIRARDARGCAGSEPKPARVLRGAALDDEVVEERAIALDRGGDVAWVDLLVVVDLTRDLVSGEELRNDVAIVTLAHDRIVDGVPASLEHLVDEPVDLRERLGRRRLEILLELLPLALPLVLVQSRLEHPLLGSAFQRAFKPVGTARYSPRVKVLLVGSGGREHSLAWKLSQAPGLEELHAAPGNPGIATLGRCHPVRAEDGEGLLALAGSLDADLVVVGPEAPLVAGVADELRHAGVPVFGPSASAARIEGSKSFAKAVMRDAGVPTARTLSVAQPPCVIKADGLAAGKGVFVCYDQADVDRALNEARSFGDAIVLEELLEGEEISVFALCDGTHAVTLPAVQDFKRAHDGDLGPNTGGMGSYSPVAGVAAAETEALVDAIHRPVIAELAARGTPFIGVLFAGVMLTDDGPRVLEFNCRFGDPETQSLLPRLDADLLGPLTAAAAGDLGGDVEVAENAAVTVVLTAGDYPAAGDVGSPIEGIASAEKSGAVVFHAGTALKGDRFVTNGGRILDVTATGESVAQARDRAYAACERISFSGMRYRRDIAAMAHV